MKRILIILLIGGIMTEMLTALASALGQQAVSAAMQKKGLVSSGTQQAPSLGQSSAPPQTGGPVTSGIPTMDEGGTVAGWKTPPPPKTIGDHLVDALKGLLHKDSNAVSIQKNLAKDAHATSTRSGGLVSPEDAFVSPSALGEEAKQIGLRAEKFGGIQTLDMKGIVKSGPMTDDGHVLVKALPGEKFEGAPDAATTIADALASPGAGADANAAPASGTVVPAPPVAQPAQPAPMLDAYKPGMPLGGAAPMVNGAQPRMDMPGGMNLNISNNAQGGNATAKANDVNWGDAAVAISTLLSKRLPAPQLNALGLGKAGAQVQPFSAIPAGSRPGSAIPPLGR